jgi:hypothetical protein
MSAISTRKTDDSYVLAIPLYNGQMTLDLFEFLRTAGVTRVRKVLQLIDEESWGDVRDKLLDEMENACQRILGGDLDEKLESAQARVDEKKAELLEARGSISALKLSRRKADEDGRLFLDIRIKQAEHDADMAKDRLACAMMDLKALSKGQEQVQKALEVIRKWRQK